MANQPPFSGAGNDLNIPITPADYENEINDNFTKCRDEILGLDSRLLAITGPLTTLNMSRRLINADDVLVPGSDGLVIVDTSGGPVTLTLPLASSAPTDDKLRLFYIQHIAGTDVINIETTPPDAFPNGLGKIVVQGKAGGMMYVGVWNDGAGDDQWVYGPPQRNLVHAQQTIVVPAASWTFPAPFQIPFDVIAINTNDAAFTAPGGGSPSITSNIDQIVRVTAQMVVNSTGAGAYQAFLVPRVNTVNVANATHRFFLSGNRDDTLVQADFVLELAAGDVLDIAITSIGLTGNLELSNVIVESLA